MTDEQEEIISGISDLFKPLKEWTEIKMIEDATGMPAQKFANMFLKVAKDFDASGCNKHATRLDNYKALRDALREEYAPGMDRDEAFALGTVVGLAFAAITRMNTAE